MIHIPEWLIKRSLSQNRVALQGPEICSANVVRKQLADLSRQINADISPVYTYQKIKDEINFREDKPPLRVNNAWCIHSSVACVMQAVLASRADTYTNELKSREDRQSETASESSTIWRQKTSHRVFES